MVFDLKKRPEMQLKAAIPLMLLASLFLALMALVVKVSSELTPSSLVFWRNFVSLVLLLPWLQFGPPYVPIAEKIKTRQWKIHFTRGITSFISSFLFFYAIRYMDLTSVTVLFNTIPIFVPIVVLIWHKVPIHHNLWWAIGVAFLGILLIVQPGSTLFQSASLIVLLAAVVGAVSLVSLRYGTFSEPSWRMQFYLFAICMVCAGLLTLFSFKSSWEQLTHHDIRMLLLVGVCGFLYQLSLTAATKFAPIRLLSPFLYLSMIFTLIFDKVIWKAPFSTLTIIGFVCIVIGAFLTVVLYPKKDLES